MSPQQEPRLTYFVELGAPELARLFDTEGLVQQLSESRAALSMAMLDLSHARLSVMRRLAEARVPVTAWLVLEPAAGYWLTADNVERARARYGELRRWAAQDGLAFAAVGLDIEPALDDARALIRHGRRAVWRLMRSRRSSSHLARARAGYARLVQEIQADGLRVETYQFPLVVDERRAHSTLLQRSLGIVDVAADREVLMLYRSLLHGPAAEALVDTYGPDAEAIGLGITGGGVEFVLEALGSRRLDLSRLLRDLRRARRYTPHLYVFSLEGCVQQGFFAALSQTDLDQPEPRSALRGMGQAMRAALRTTLRAGRLWEHLTCRDSRT